METIIEFIKNTSGLSFLIMFFFLFIGIYVNQVSGRGDYKYYIVLLSVVLIIGFKIATSEGFISPRYHLHILELMALPVSFSMIFFMRNVIIERRYLDIITHVIIIFQLLNITRNSVFATLIPQYSLMFTFLASFIGFFGLWLLSYNLFRKRALWIIGVATFCSAISLTKWLLPLVIVYIGAVTYHFLKTRSITWNIITLVPIIVISAISLYSTRDMIAGLSGYSSFDKYINQRVLKTDYKQEVIEGRELNSHIGGVGDGARLFVWTYHIEEWRNGNLLTGVSLNFSNPFEIPEHNIFVGYITRLGIFSGIFFMFIYLYIRLKHVDLRLRIPYIGLLLFLLLLFSAGGLYGFPLACLIISAMIGLFQNKLKEIV